MNPEFDCSTCGDPLDENGHCINVNCVKAQEQATKGAARETKKASAGAAPYEPRAFTSSGKVD